MRFPKGTLPLRRIVWALVKGIPVVPVDSAIILTAEELVKTHTLPPKALQDAMHIAVCGHHKIDILLTWNCTHIANPHILKLVRKHFGLSNLSMPEVVTPESLLGDENVGPDP